MISLPHKFRLFCTFSISGVLLGVISGCATMPQPGMLVPDVREKLGVPALIIQTNEGVNWFYPSGPLGTTTFAVSINRDGVVTRVRNVLTDDQIQTLTAGSTGDEVLAAIGPPFARVRFDNLHATAWDYRYQDTWGYRVDLSVMIDDTNRVTGRVLHRTQADGSH